MSIVTLASHSWAMEESKRVIEKYQDPAFAGALGGLNRFYASYKKEFPSTPLTFPKVKNILEKLPIYQLHVPRKEKFKRRNIGTAPGSQSITCNLSIYA